MDQILTSVEFYFDSEKQMNLINAKEMTGLAPLEFHVILNQLQTKSDITSKTAELRDNSLLP